MMQKLSFVVVLVVAFHILTAAQTQPKNDPFAPFQFYVGTWVGTGQGQPGNSTVERTYEFILDNKFLRVSHKSIYAPQEKNPKGEVHEDVAYLSFDRSAKRFVMRQFHKEGFVVHYTVDAQSILSETLSFASQSIENIPAGWRARETYKKTGPDEFTETFELAAPGKEFEIYSTNNFKRKKNL
jgi:hypothetical protein